MKKLRFVLAILRVLALSVCERKDFLSNYCYIISIVVVVIWGYSSLVGFSCGLRLSGETHLRLDGFETFGGSGGIDYELVGLTTSWCD